MLNGNSIGNSIGSNMNQNIYLRYVIFLSCLIRVCSLANIVCQPNKFMFKTPAAICLFFWHCIKFLNVTEKVLALTQSRVRRPHSFSRTHFAPLGTDCDNMYMSWQLNKSQSYTQLDMCHKSSFDSTNTKKANLIQDR